MIIVPLDDIGRTIASADAGWPTDPERETEGSGLDPASRLCYFGPTRQGNRNAAAVPIPDTGNLIRLELPSIFEMIDLAQAVTDQLCRVIGLDDDSQHWVGVAVRESVVNAIKHGNQFNPAKTVTLEFTITPAVHPMQLAVLIRDEGRGFDPGLLPDPLAPENLLKESGRGIFFMRRFMDEVEIRRAPEGGMEVLMVKRLAPSSGGPA
jgi:serine/threonine-protein kinase RsbW